MINVNQVKPSKKIITYVIRFSLSLLLNKEAMKRIQTIVLLLLVTFNTGCLADDPMNTKIDASTEENMKKSLESLSDDLTKEQFKRLQSAFASSVMKKTMKLAFSGKHSKEEIEKASFEAGKKALNGRTPKEIIEAHYKNGGKDLPSSLFSDSNTIKKEASNEKSKVEQSIQKIKVGDSVTRNKIKITVNSISIHKLTPVKSDSYLAYEIPKDQFLLVFITLENESEGKIIHIQNPWNKTILIDNFDNYFNPKGLSNYSIAEKVIESKAIKPKQKFEDTIAYELPLENAKSFTLQFEPVFYKPLAGSSLKKLPSEKFELSFTRDDIK